MSHSLRHTYNIEDYLVLEDYLLLDQDRLLIEYYHRLEQGEGLLKTSTLPEQPTSSKAVRVEVNRRQIYNKVISLTQP